MRASSRRQLRAACRCGQRQARGEHTRGSTHGTGGSPVDQVHRLTLNRRPLRPNALASARRSLRSTRRTTAATARRSAAPIACSALRRPRSGGAVLDRCGRRYRVHRWLAREGTEMIDGPIANDLRVPGGKAHAAQTMDAGRLNRTGVSTPVSRRVRQALAALEKVPSGIPRSELAWCSERPFDTPRE